VVTVLYNACCGCFLVPEFRRENHGRIYSDGRETLEQIDLRQFVFRGIFSLLQSIKKKLCRSRDSRFSDQ